MNQLSLTLSPSEYGAAANIALDEALLESAEAGDQTQEVLRLWHPTEATVVIGRSSPIRDEVNLEYCAAHEIPVFRRSSGGASIVTAPGCLMYAVLLSYRKRPQLRMLEQAHQFVMTKMQDALNSLNIETKFLGTCDLTIDDKKVSGNALRCKKNWMIYHGTMICESMDLQLVSNCLGQPKRQPEYRAGRSHADFLCQIPTSTSYLADAIAKTWKTVEETKEWPKELTERLVETKYTTEAWNYKL